jgi:toxin FitB
MFLLDTNVISELRKKQSGKADPNVVRWIERGDASEFFLSVVSIQELEIGVLKIARKDKAQGALLHAWLHRQVLPAFEERILPIDTLVALRCAQLHVPNVRSSNDALIAATALVHGMTVLTRNVADFENTGASMLNPWLVS